MLTFQKVLFPFDFSQRCIQAVPYVASISRKFGSHIVLLHVFDIHNGLAYGMASSTAAYAAYADLIRQRRAEELESFGQQGFEELSVTRVVEVGNTARTITRYADEHGIDLIMMPTHGHGRFRRFLLGSIAAKVLHDSACPVWTTAHSETLVPDASQEIRNIVCAVDLCARTVEVIHAARDIADRYGALVRLVHAIPTPEAGPSSAIDEGFKRFLFDTASAQIAARQKEAGTDYDVCVEYGNVPSVIRNEALRCGAHLVVIGRGRLQEFLGSLRTNVGAIISESPCPVLSLQST
jgi:nucleotide-binding universal stress UspA family protein